MQEQGYDLRSRCLLVPDGTTSFELIANDGRIENFELDTKTADTIFAEAVAKAKRLGLPWQDKPITLVPEARLIEVVRKSREAKSGAGE